MEISAVKPLVNNPPTPSNNAPAPKRQEVVKQVQPLAANAENDVNLADQQVKDLSKAEKQRLDTVVKGARAYQGTIGASGMTFTIFKDSSGQFITRFTNKDTGAVTYVPEPNVLKFAESDTATLLEVKA